MNWKPFLKTICLNPADDGPRLVFADALEESGECERAEFIRIQIAIANKPGIHDIHALVSRSEELLAKSRREWTMAGLPPAIFYDEYGIVFRGCYTAQGIKAEFRRGFPEILTLRFEEWQRHYETLIDSMPVREVRLTTMPNIHNYAVLDEGTFKVNIVIEINGNWYRADATSFDIAVITILKRAFPGHDAARPIRYTLLDPVLHGDGSPLPRGIDPRTIFPYRAETSVGGIP